jgi:hypothetical protein
LERKPWKDGNVDFSVLEDHLSPQLPGFGVQEGRMEVKGAFLLMEVH